MQKRARPDLDGVIDRNRASGDGDYALIRTAIAFLTEHRLLQPELDDLAAHLGLGTTQCQKLFKRWCGLSPKEFIGALSHDHARRLLADSRSVLETAHETGLSGGGRLHDLFLSHEAMVPGVYRRGCEGLTIWFGRHMTPFGQAIAAATGQGLAALAFVDEDAGQSEDDVIAEYRTRWPRATFVEDPERTRSYLNTVFDPAAWSGERPLRIVMIGTDFEVRVWQALTKIPMGRAVSYGDIARHLDQPTAARAVGSAVGRNPLSFVVPCHRVMRADGGLGGYHWGLTRKRAIIGWEAGRLARAVD